MSGLSLRDVQTPPGDLVSPNAIRGPEDSLRRLDWRFLLPSAGEGRFRHLVMIGGTEALGTRLIEDGFAASVSLEACEPGAADAVVVLADQYSPGLDLEAALSMLSPDGVLYYEADRRDRAGRGYSLPATRRIVRNAGFDVIGRYWIHSDFKVRGLFLPLDRPESIRWYLRCSQVAATALEELRSSVQCAIARVSPGNLDRLVGRYAIVAAGPDASRGAPGILDAPAVPETFRNPAARPILIANGSDEWGRVVLLPFAPSEDAPIGVVKLARLAARTADIEAEQNALRKLREVLDPSMSASIPDPLGSWDRWGLKITAESYLRGRALSTIFGRWRVSDQVVTRAFNLAADWLENLSVDSPAEIRRWEKADHEQWIAQPIKEYLLHCTPDVECRNLVEMALTEARSLEGRSVPLVWMHYAYGPWNLLVDGDRLSVIDWEGFDMDLPLLSLLYFAHSVYLAVERPRSPREELACFERLFCRTPAPGSIEASIHGRIEGLVNRLGLPRMYIPVAVTMLWAARAASIARRRTRVADAGDDIRTEYMRILANHRIELFDRYRGSTSVPGGSGASGRRSGGNAGTDSSGATI